MKEDVKVTLATDKDPYIKRLTNDKIINLTGESGSGKSYFSSRWKEDKDYIIIDTDKVFNKAKVDEANIHERKLRENLQKKYGSDLPELTDNIRIFYNDILKFFEGKKETIVIDSALLKYVPIEEIKGTVIVMRTSVITCYERCIKRYEKRHVRIIRKGV